MLTGMIQTPSSSRPSRGLSVMPIIQEKLSPLGICQRPVRSQLNGFKAAVSRKAAKPSHSR